MQDVYPNGCTVNGTVQLQTGVVNSNPSYFTNEYSCNVCKCCSVTMPLLCCKDPFSSACTLLCHRVYLLLLRWDGRHCVRIHHTLGQPKSGKQGQDDDATPLPQVPKANQSWTPSDTRATCSAHKGQQIGQWSLQSMKDALDEFAHYEERLIQLGLPRLEKHISLEPYWLKVEYLESLLQSSSSFQVEKIKNQIARDHGLTFWNHAGAKGYSKLDTKRYERHLLSTQRPTDRPMVPAVHEGCT